MIREELLHFIWQSKLLLKHRLLLASGEPLEVISTGTYNRDAGPDFFNSKIRIRDTIWAGNIEFHIRSSDWNLHKHSIDKAYDNVILHVVYHHNTDIRYRDGNPIPVLELRQYLPPLLLRRYRLLQKSKAAIPCQSLFRIPQEPRFSLWIQRLLVERLERKTGQFADMLRRYDNHWEKAFYAFTARSFGMKTNAQPFEWLAESLPLEIIAKHKNSLFQLRALTLGIAGFLRACKPELQELAAEFVFLKAKFSLTELDRSIWKHSRTRPAGFPVLRIEQFTRLLFRSNHLLSNILAAKDTEHLIRLYIDPEEPCSLGKESAVSLLINSVIPVLFSYGLLQNQPECCERALHLYDLLPPEKNRITAFWKQLDISAENSSHSQALIELKTQYCSEIRCLHCAIGQNVMLNE